MGLCEKCHEWGESRSAYIRTWDHCHHGEEKPCDVCFIKGIQYLRPRGDLSDSFLKLCRFCPECGRNLGGGA